MSHSLLEEYARVNRFDCEQVEYFCKHFDITVSDELQKALDKVKNENTKESVDELTFQIAKMIVTSDKQLFHDELLKAMVDEVTISYDSLTFDRELRDKLKEEK